MGKDVNNIVVSDEFIEIYHNFNVCDQVDKIKNLTKREMYLLLTLCLDKHVPDHKDLSKEIDVIVKHNLINFDSEIMEIFDIQDDKTTTNEILLNLITETGDPYIETKNIISSSGESLPKILSKQEVRDIKINMIEDN